LCSRRGCSGCAAIDARAFRDAAGRVQVSVGPFCYINGEDGIALADEALRSEIASLFPAM